MSAMKQGKGGKFVKGNKSGTPKKAAGAKKGLPAFLARKIGKKGGRKK